MYIYREFLIIYFILNKHISFICIYIFTSRIVLSKFK